MIPTTLVLGASAQAREAAIAAVLDSNIDTALILEGLPDGQSRLDAPTSPALLHVARIAPGCMCCIGNLTMRVTLNRVLRRKPERLYIALASAEHLADIRAFLSASPYGNLLQLTQELRA